MQLSAYKILPQMDTRNSGFAVAVLPDCCQRHARFEENLLQDGRSVGYFDGSDGMNNRIAGKRLSDEQIYTTGLRQ